MDFFYSHTTETIYQRYRYLKKSLSHDEALRLCTLFCIGSGLVLLQRGKKNYYLVRVTD